MHPLYSDLSRSYPKPTCLLFPLYLCLLCVNVYIWTYLWILQSLSNDISVQECVTARKWHQSSLVAQFMLAKRTYMCVKCERWCCGWKMSFSRNTNSPPMCKIFFFIVHCIGYSVYYYEISNKFIEKQEYAISSNLVISISFRSIRTTYLFDHTGIRVCEIIRNMPTLRWSNMLKCDNSQRNNRTNITWNNTSYFNAEDVYKAN